jgi:putative ABC transport system substrate-binding protein
MNRRNAILSLLALTASAGRAAEPPSRMPRIAYLGPSAETAPHLLKAFQEGLGERGYVDERNVVIEYRWTNAGTRMTDASVLLANARDLVARQVDVLAASIDPAILAASKATRTIPIVMLNASDPVELGLVSSLAHPGGNITGLTRVSPELIGKHLQLLLEVVPNANRVGLLLGDSNSMNRLIVTNAREAAQKRAVALQIVELRAPQDLEAAFVALKDGRAQGLLVGYVGGGWFFTQRERLAQLALAQRLPAIFPTTENVEAGGLISYSPDSVANYRRAAAFIDRILRGTKPGDIPIEQPTQFELAINMKTAKAMNIAIPQSLLLRADRIIQ